MEHRSLCRCSQCQALDKRHPLEGSQLTMFEQRAQRAPTEAEALANLYRLAGKSAAFDRAGQRALIL